MRSSLPFEAFESFKIEKSQVAKVTGGGGGWTQWSSPASPYEWVSADQMAIIDGEMLIEQTGPGYEGTLGGLC